MQALYINPMKNIFCKNDLKDVKTQNTYKVLGKRFTDQICEIKVWKLTFAFFGSIGDSSIKSTLHQFREL